VEVQGTRDNPLYGYGLVVGLAGTGDTEAVFFTAQSISGMLGRLGIRIDPKLVRVRNVAAVMVTAKLTSFTRPGTRIDVNVSSMGNARSLAGGVLLITPLTGPDARSTCWRRGSVQAGGFDAAAFGTSVQKNQPTSGSVPAGGIVERAVLGNLEKAPMILGPQAPGLHHVEPHRRGHQQGAESRGGARHRPGRHRDQGPRRLTRARPSRC